MTITVDIDEPFLTRAKIRSFRFNVSLTSFTCLSKLQSKQHETTLYDTYP